MAKGKLIHIHTHWLVQLTLSLAEVFFYRRDWRYPFPGKKLLPRSSRRHPIVKAKSPKTILGTPLAPQPQHTNHERSVSGRNSLFLGYPELACVGIGAGEAAVVVWSVSRSLAPPSTRRIQDVGFRSQLLLLGYPEAARVGEAETLVGGAVVAQDERRRRGRSRLLIGKAAMRKGRGSRGTDDGGVPHAPQPQRADHERSVSGPKAYPYSSVTQGPPALESEVATPQ